MTRLKHDIQGVACQFQIQGGFHSGEPCGSGHINDTCCVTFHQAGVLVRYILQRINHNIFKNPVALMENVQRVTSHLATKVAGQIRAVLPKHAQAFRSHSNVERHIQKELR